MKLIITGIKEKVFEGEFISVILPSVNGQIEIMPGHSPFLSPLVTGKIIYKESDGEKKEIEIEKGFVEVNKNEVVVVL